MNFKCGYTLVPTCSSTACQASFGLQKEALVLIFITIGEAGLFLNFIKLESYNMYSFVSGFFGSTLLPWELPTLLCVEALYSLSVLYIQSRDFVTINLSIAQMCCIQFGAIMNTAIMSISEHDFWSRNTCVFLLGGNPGDDQL